MWTILLNSCYQVLRSSEQPSLSLICPRGLYMPPYIKVTFDIRNMFNLKKIPNSENLTIKNIYKTYSFINISTNHAFYGVTCQIMNLNEIKLPREVLGSNPTSCKLGFYCRYFSTSFFFHVAVKVANMWNFLHLAKPKMWLYLIRWIVVWCSRR